MDADAQQRHQQRKLLELAAERLLAEVHSRGKAASSSYDFVKIKVRLGVQLEHYYILSRFLLSRMLTVITLPQHKAVRVALDVKKQLVDCDRLDITQEELEEVLFALLRQRGYGDEYVRRYQMVTRFFQQKRPLIILIAGSACTGKSSLAQQLASRLNLPNVLQTDVLYELLRASGAGDLPAEPLWRRLLLPGTGPVREFQRECATIRRALDGDLCKCIRDGKSIIIEGMHVDPGLFLLEFGDPRGGASPGSSGNGGAGELGTVEEGGSGVLSAAASAPGNFEMVRQLVALQVADAACASTSAAYTREGAAGEITAADMETAAGTPKAASTGAQAGPAAGWNQGPPAVRRTASFGDAVQRLSYGSLHRLQSPWRDHGVRALPRPRSARLDSNSMERRQAVFMLQSPEEVDGSEGEGGDSMVLPPPQLSPRLAPCISLPPVLEHSPQRGPCSISMPTSARRRSTHSGDSQQTVPEDVAMETYNAVDSAAAAAGNDEQQAAVPAAAAAVNSGNGMQQEGTLGGGSTATAATVAAAVEQRQHHSSVAAADAAAAAASGTGPVFVPICLAIRDEEYEGMLHDWLARQQRALGGGGSGGGGGGAEPAADDAEAVQRLRQLQEHLRQYSATGVPVVEFNTSDMGQALDSMHAYVLQCIELALN